MNWGLNIASGLQIVVGAMITALAAVTTGQQTSIATAILGGLTTVVAAYMARMRGTGEPEKTKIRLGLKDSIEVTHLLGRRLTSRLHRALHA